jgi:hypothetical protein
MSRAQPKQTQCSDRAELGSKGSSICLINPLDGQNSMNATQCHVLRKLLVIIPESRSAGRVARSRRPQRGEDPSLALRQRSTSARARVARGRTYAPSCRRPLGRSPARRGRQPCTGEVLPSSGHHSSFAACLTDPAATSGSTTVLLYHWNSEQPGVTPHQTGRHNCYRSATHRRDKYLSYLYKSGSRICAKVVMYKEGFCSMTDYCTTN